MTVQHGLERDFSNALHGNVVVVGIGNPLLGDDGLGPAFTHSLSGVDGITCIDAGTTPENHISPVVRANPDTVLLVDAVDFGLHPGDYIIEDPQKVDSASTATHDVGLPSIAAYIHHETGAEVFLLGVQPKQTVFGRKLSPNIRRTLKKLERGIRLHMESARIQKKVATRGDS
jgi:hydrogenase 3 maturation protease